MQLIRGGIAVTAGLAFFAFDGPPAAEPSTVIELRVATTTTLAIPRSIRTEHEAIHSELIAATKAPGRVGTAARALNTVLHPHFVREEQIALPPLGMLARLAAGVAVSGADASDVLAMTDSLKRELPQMLEEHANIRKAVEHLRAAAAAERATRYEELAAQLVLHAQTEEEVLYPAAILVGEVIRGRARAGRSSHK